MPILMMAVGFRLECVMVDVMHCVDLGVAAHILGNVFWELVLRKAFAPLGTQETNVGVLMRQMKAYYKQLPGNPSRTKGKLPVERLRTTKGWPKLKAKAAATRHPARFALDLAQRHSDGSDHDLRMVAVVQLLCRFYELIAGEEMFLSAAAQREVRDRP